MRWPSALLLGCAAAILSTQSTGAQERESYDDFRNRVMAEHDAFRNSVLDSYSKFFNSVWQEYEQFQEAGRWPEPKPLKAPVAPEPDKTQPAVTLPSPPQPEKPKVEVARKDVEVPETKRPQRTSGKETTIDFYGVPVAIAGRAPMLIGKLEKGADFAAQWEKLSADPAAIEAAAAIAAKARALGLNDFLTFDLVREYVRQTNPRAHSTVRTALVHYIASHLGFNIRVALVNGEGVILLNTLQTLYGKPYYNVAGEKYYLFPDGVDFSGPVRVSTCPLPADADHGRAVDMRFNRPLTLPVKPHDFTLTAAGLTLAGTVNANIYPMLYRYPQTDYEVYAVSSLDPSLRRELVAQLKSQLDSVAPLEAADRLLGFTQTAIKYATDEQAHGFEKPYFLEEWLYYPLNDCEDRAVFYSYMLWNALGIECQMINYPGHESVALTLPGVTEGDRYESEGKTFLISDPTYIGARTGQGMPVYATTPPRIDYHYHR